MRLIDMTGKKFGRLTVIKQSPNRGHIVRWKCICDCGKTKILNGRDVRDGKTKSCGCLFLETRLSATKHGLVYSSEYQAWGCAKTRCSNPKNKRYRLYGSLGIRMCDEWQKSFAAFYAHIGPKPSAEHSLDRYPNNSGNYEPGNVRWATRSQQMKNRRPFKRTPRSRPLPSPRNRKLGSAGA